MTKEDEKTTSKPSDGMETVMPKVRFLGFPFGGKGVWFEPGKESAPMRGTYAKLLREKGLVTDRSTKADAGEKSKA